jgi:uncharacterized damage-inducible protein DinB
VTGYILIPRRNADKEDDMIDTLKPVWKQFGETYEALRYSLATVPDGDLTWSPGGEAMSVARLIQHIASANINYMNCMRPREGSEQERAREYQEAPPRAWLVERLNESEHRVREGFDAMTPESLTRSCAEDWAPLGDSNLVAGPLDALWFALQAMRHTAYHLGQLNVYLLVLAARRAE